MEEITLILERSGFPISEAEIRKEKIDFVEKALRYEIERRRRLLEPELFLPGKSEVSQ